MEKHFVVIEKAESNYSAFSPDLMGCITVGDTIDETVSFMKEAIELYLEGMQMKANLFLFQSVYTLYRARHI